MAKDMVFGRIRNGDTFYSGNTLWKKTEPGGNSFSENAESVDNPRIIEFFNDDEIIEFVEAGKIEEDEE